MPPRCRRWRSLRLSENRCNDVPGHVSQAEISPLITVGKSLVIDAKQMQQRGVEIVHVDLVLDGVVAHLIGLAEGHSWAHTAASHED